MPSGLKTEAGQTTLLSFASQTLRLYPISHKAYTSPEWLKLDVKLTFEYCHQQFIDILAWTLRSKPMTFWNTLNMLEIKHLGERELECLTSKHVQGYDWVSQIECHMPHTATQSYPKHEGIEVRLWDWMTPSTPRRCGHKIRAHGHARIQRRSLEKRHAGWSVKREFQGSIPQDMNHSPCLGGRCCSDNRGIGWRPRCPQDSKNHSSRFVLSRTLEVRSTINVILLVLLANWIRCQQKRTTSTLLSQDPSCSAKFRGDVPCWPWKDSPIQERKLASHFLTAVCGFHPSQSKKVLRALGPRTSSGFLRV